MICQNSKDKKGYSCLVAEAHVASEHLILELPFGRIGGSALTSDLEVPKSTNVDQIMPGIPITYVSARNTIFLSVALGWAEVLDAGDIFIGVNALHYSGYPYKNGDEWPEMNSG
jgi:7-cyano-7-deazaguanine synthase